FNQPPVFFNEATKNKLYNSEYKEELLSLEKTHDAVFEEKKEAIRALVDAMNKEDQAQIDLQNSRVADAEKRAASVKEQVVALIQKNDPTAETKDTDYVFITFVMNYLPKGVVGLLLAVIFSAAMSSTSSELNALSSTTTIDLYKRSIKKEGSDRHYLMASKLFTVLWGLLAIMFATLASLVDNLIEAVNILGSVFYGTILGIFLVAFYFKYIKSRAVFIAAIIAELTVIYCYFYTPIGYLWFNVIGCFLVIVLGFLFQRFMVVEEPTV